MTTGSVKGFYDGVKVIHNEVDEIFTVNLKQEPAPGQIIKPNTVEEILERLGLIVPQPVVSRHVTDFDEL